MRPPYEGDALSVGWGQPVLQGVDDPFPAPLLRPRSPLRRDQLHASWRVMFVIELTYKADLADIDAQMAAHVRFLKKYYAAGNFLVSGRKIPRDGGIILAVGDGRQQIEAIVEEDPFYIHGLADFRIVEFRASQRAKDIQQRIERRDR
jgi:uncharacterized protein YciI